MHYYTTIPLENSLDWTSSSSGTRVVDRQEVSFYIGWVKNLIMKNISLTHRFEYRATREFRQQLASSGSLQNLTNMIVEQSNTMNPDIYNPLKYRGDAFEWIAEFFFKFFDGDNLFLNMTDYQPTKASDDYGVDGVAKYTKDLSKVVCLQHKFKSNRSKKLSSKEDGLSNFGVNANTKYSCEIDEKYLIVFTNASDIERTTSEGIYRGCINCINGKMISRYVDTNQAFWKIFQETVSKVSI